jgi:hypothetical protein
MAIMRGGFWFTVLAAVQFDSQLGFGAIKIHNVWTKRLLATEFPSCESPIPQMPPEYLFHLCWILTESPDKISILSSQQRGSPHLNPLPQGERR